MDGELKKHIINLLDKGIRLDGRKPKKIKEREHS